MFFPLSKYNSDHLVNNGLQDVYWCKLVKPSVLNTIKEQKNINFNFLRSGVWTQIKNRFRKIIFCHLADIYKYLE